MALTTVKTGQIADGGVTRDDINTATAGKAVIAKAVQGTGMSLTSTGADAGTGDVTFNAAAASETVAGAVERLTDAEFTTGTDTTRYVTAAQSKSGVQVVTNKDLTSTTNTFATVTQTTNSATLTGTIGSRKNWLIATAQTASTTTIASPTGTGATDHSLIIRIKAAGTISTITWNSVFRAIGVTLPVSLVNGKTLYAAGWWNAADSKIDITAVGVEA